MRVGAVRARTPAAPGPFVLELDLDAGAGAPKATNRYQSTVRPASREP